MENLRNGKRGKMNGSEEESSPFLSFLLPEELDTCNHSVVLGFQAGDHRVNENPGKDFLSFKILSES